MHCSITDLVHRGAVAHGQWRHASGRGVYLRKSFEGSRRKRQKAVPQRSWPSIDRRDDSQSIPSLSKFCFDFPDSQRNSVRLCGRESTPQTRRIRTGIAPRAAIFKHRTHDFAMQETRSRRRSLRLGIAI